MAVCPWCYLSGLPSVWKILRLPKTRIPIIMLTAGVGRICPDTVNTTKVPASTMLAVSGRVRDSFCSQRPEKSFHRGARLKPSAVRIPRWTPYVWILCQPRYASRNVLHRTMNHARSRPMPKSSHVKRCDFTIDSWREKMAAMSELSGSPFL